MGMTGSIIHQQQYVLLSPFQLFIQSHQHFFHDLSIHPCLWVGIIPAPIRVFNVLHILETMWFRIFSNDNGILLFPRSIYKKMPMCSSAWPAFHPYIAFPFPSGLYQVDLSKSFRFNPCSTHPLASILV